jgi:hypothetical protein
MKKLAAIPFYILFIIMILGLAMIVVAAYVPIVAILISGLVLFHLAGWVMIVRFFVSVIGLFSTVVDPK